MTNVIPGYTYPTTSLLTCQGEAGQGVDSLCPWKQSPAPFHQILPTFPAQTLKHAKARAASELPAKGTPAGQAASYSPDSTCRFGDLGFISTSQMQSDGSGVRMWQGQSTRGQQVRH